ncbi:MAG: hypothetical protein PVJ02_01310 [Gemmatimonadota bacterium]|jgi:hypothetical protein
MSGRMVVITGASSGTGAELGEDPVPRTSRDPGAQAPDTEPTR